MRKQAVIMTSVDTSKMKSKRHTALHDLGGTQVIQHVINQLKLANIEDIYLEKKDNTDIYSEDFNAYPVINDNQTLEAVDTVFVDCRSPLVSYEMYNSLFEEDYKNIYAVDSQVLIVSKDNIEHVTMDTIANMAQAVNATKGDFEAFIIETRRDLADARYMIQSAILDRHMDNGVTIIDPENTYISSTVKIGMDTTIYPGVVISGETTIGEDCLIRSNSELNSVRIGNNVEVRQSVLTESEIGDDTVIGPFAQLRAGTKLGNEVRIGNFVETKKSYLDDGAKISHLSYIGDAEVGRRTNIGCGAITVNYDGENKFKTIIGDDVFIGCNTNMMAPIEIQDRSVVAAGSTVTDDIPKDSLAIARERQTTKKHYYKN